MVRYLVLLLVVVMVGCAGGNVMPGDPDTGCTRMISKATAGGAGGVLSGDAKYCKYIEKGQCPEMEPMSFEQLREMCRDM
jgi:hypothetical protein